MKCTSSRCDHCGATLEIPIQAIRIACESCHAALEVERTDSVVTTRMVEELDARVERAEREISRLRARSRAKSLDEGWRRQSESLRRRSGRSRLLTTSEANWIIGLGALLVVVGIGGWLMTERGAYLRTAIVGSTFFLMGIFHHERADKFAFARRLYLSRRRRVLAEHRKDAEGPHGG